MSDNGHSEETANRIRVDNHESGHPKGHFYGASGGGFTGKWNGQKGTFLEGGIRVPAIISYPPKVPRGESRDQVITVMDWLPTIMDLCGIKCRADDPKLDGHSVVKILENPKAKSGYQGILNFQWHRKWAVRMNEWKLIGREGANNYQLFRLTDKNPERINYAKDRNDILAEMLQIRKAWMKDVFSSEG